MSTGANLVPPRFNFQQVVRHLYLRSDYYEPFERYQPGTEYVTVVQPLLPLATRVVREAFWTHVQPLGAAVPMQGWKLHVSATPGNARAILERVTRICVQANVPFKFASDPFVLSLLLGKGCARGSSGKFMTLYPRDEQQARTLLETLYGQLKDFEGPYVLSDRRYRDCAVLYYRYGGFTPITRRDPDGALTSYLIRPDLSLEADERTPQYQQPDWLRDPFQPDEPDEDAALLNGRYEVQQVLNYSNSGGVYLAADQQTGATVVLKEARPHVNASVTGQDAVEQLRKEHRLLTLLGGSGVAPEALDLFTSWEHTFLAQSYLSGMSLHAFAVKYSPVVRTTHDLAALQSWWTLLRSVSVQVMRAVQAVHQRGVVFGDLSMNNVLVSVDEGRCAGAWLIDFEGAAQRGVDPDINMFTPGFDRPGRAGQAGTTVADDHYALGALLFSLLLPVAVLRNVKDDALPTFLQAFAADFGLPAAFVQVIEQLLASDGTLDLAALMAQLHDRVTLRRTPAILTPPRPVGAAQLERVARSALRHAIGVADDTRQDRLFPSSPQLSHSLSLDFGALGVTAALHTVNGEVPRKVREWIRRQPPTAGTAPGLFSGLAGMAVGLARLGERGLAERAYQLAQRHDHLYARVHLYGGASGFGLASLLLHGQWGDPAYLDEARRIGDLLDATARRLDGRATWPDFGPQEVGLGFGGSGVALFLLYLHAATGERRYLSLGEAALAEDLAQARTLDGGALGFPDQPGGSVLYPYWLTGSAGVGSVLVRYAHVTGHPMYRQLAGQIRLATTSKYSVFPGLFMGMAGLGMYLLDAAEFLNDPSYVQDAHRAARGVLLFSVRRAQGVTFPGDYLHRVSTDLGSGSSGVALFLHRLAAGRTNPLLPDDLLNRHGGQA